MYYKNRELLLTLKKQFHALLSYKKKLQIKEWIIKNKKNWSANENILWSTKINKYVTCSVFGCITKHPKKKTMYLFKVLTTIFVSLEQSKYWKM